MDGDESDNTLDKDGKEFMESTRSVWSFGTESRQRIGHPAPFPVALPRRLIQFYSYKHQIVLDPFAGSGTTGVAAIELERQFVLIDHSKTYCDLACERLNDIASQQNLFARSVANVETVRLADLIAECSIVQP